MDKEIMQHQKNLEVLSITDQEEEKKVSIAQKKAIEEELKSKYGTLAKAKKILGFVHLNSDTIHTLYSANPELKSLTLPPRVRRA